MSSLFRGTAIVSSLTLVSRVLGFLRDLLIARLFGATALADIFFVALRIPNTLRSFVAEGAFTSAYVPLLAEEREKSDEAMREFSSVAASGMLMVTLLIIIVGYFFAPEIVQIFAPGFSNDPKKLSKTASLFIIMLPYIPSISLVVLMNGLLTTLKHFGAGAVAQITVNGSLIVGIILAGFAPPEHQAEYLAWSIFFAAFLQYGLLTAYCKKIGYPIRYQLPKLQPPIRKMLFLMIPALLGAAVYQLSVVINTAFASLLEEGSIAWLSYADRLTQLPIGVYTIALSSVLLPDLSKSLASNNHKEAEKKLLDALRYTIFLLVPVSVLLSGLSQPIIELLFERGAFTAEDTTQAARALSVYAMGLLPLSLYTIFSRYLIAKQKPIIPATIGLIALTTSCIIALSTMGAVTSTTSFGEVVRTLQAYLPTLGSYGHVGLAFASVSASITSLIIYLILLSLFYQISLSHLILNTVQCGVAGVVVHLLLAYSASSHGSSILQLFVQGFFGSLIYLVITYLANNLEVKSLFKIFSERLRN